MLRSFLVSRRSIFSLVVGLSLMAFLGAAQAQQKKIRVVFGDVLSTETLAMLIALQLLRGFRGVKRCAWLSTSTLRVTPSIQPKHRACSTAWT